MRSERRLRRGIPAGFLNVWVSLLRAPPSVPQKRATPRLTYHSRNPQPRGRNRCAAPDNPAGVYFAHLPLNPPPRALSDPADCALRSRVQCRAAMKRARIGRAGSSIRDFSVQDGGCGMECSGWSIRDGVFGMECSGWSVRDGVLGMECSGWSVRDGARPRGSQHRCGHRGSDGGWHPSGVRAVVAPRAAVRYDPVRCVPAAQRARAAPPAEGEAPGLGRWERKGGGVSRAALRGAMGRGEVGAGARAAGTKCRTGLEIRTAD